MRVRGLVVAAVALLAVSSAAPADAAKPRPPVVMLVLDELPTGSIQRPDGAIDAGRFPGFAQLASESVWFRNAHAAHDQTYLSVASILTGRLPRTKSRVEHRRSLFTHLRRRGYRVDAFEEGTTVCPASICPRTPGYGKITANIDGGHRRRLAGLLNRVSAARRGRFVFHHAIIPHGPWVFRPSGVERARVGDDSPHLPAYPSGFSNHFITQFNQQSHLLQVGYVDRILGRLIARMKAARTWRKALVVVTADHGMSFAERVTDRRQVTPANLHEVAMVPLFVKRPGSTRARVSPRWVRGTDLAATVTALLGSRMRGTDGANAFGRTVARRRGVRMLARDLGRVLVARGADVDARRAKDRVARERVFGAGTWPRLFDIGPSRDLRGRSVGTLRVGLSGIAHATFKPPAGGLNVSPAGQVLPLTAGGTVADLGSPRIREVALAVNGVIRATGTTFRLADSAGTERFYLNIQEGDLRVGANDFALYEIRRDGGGRFLTPLGALR